MTLRLLDTALSGLAAFQRSLETTSNNISNVNTEGYSRQRTELATRPGQY
ncbi:MAG: flagellar basal body protein, partial [Methylomonas sp.]|nr:flagellar basal body protein [Methylomonas sp.]